MDLDDSLRDAVEAGDERRINEILRDAPDADMGCESRYVILLAFLSIQYGKESILRNVLEDCQFDQVLIAMLRLFSKHMHRESYFANIPVAPIYSEMKFVDVIGYAAEMDFMRIVDDLLTRPELKPEVPIASAAYAGANKTAMMLLDLPVRLGLHEYALKYALEAENVELVRYILMIHPEVRIDRVPPNMTILTLLFARYPMILRSNDPISIRGRRYYLRNIFGKEAVLLREALNRGWNDVAKKIAEILIGPDYVLNAYKYAFEHNDREIIRLLADADPSSLDESLRVAVGNKFPRKMIDYLLDLGASPTNALIEELTSSIKMGGTMREFFALGAYPDIVLEEIVRRGVAREDQVRDLIQFGARNLSKALALAIMHSKGEIIGLLIREGANEQKAISRVLTEGDLSVYALDNLTRMQVPPIEILRAALKSGNVKIVARALVGRSSTVLSDLIRRLGTADPQMSDVMLAAASILGSRVLIDSVMSYFRPSQEGLNEALKIALMGGWYHPATFLIEEGADPNMVIDLLPMDPNIFDIVYPKLTQESLEAFIQRGLRESSVTVREVLDRIGDLRVRSLLASGILSTYELLEEISRGNLDPTIIAVEAIRRGQTDLPGEIISAGIGDRVPMLLEALKTDNNYIVRLIMNEGVNTDRLLVLATDLRDVNLLGKILERRLGDSDVIMKRAAEKGYEDILGFLYDNRYLKKEDVLEAAGIASESGLIDLARRLTDIGRKMRFQTIFAPIA